MTAPVSMRDAQDSDAPAIASLIRRAFEQQCRLYDDWSLPPMRETTESVSEAISSGLVLVAEKDGRIVGSVRATDTGPTVVIGRLVVEPAYQGSGIGTALVKAAESRFPSATRFEIFTGHRSAPALHLYESLGYQRQREERVHDGLTLVYLFKDHHTSR